MTEKSEIRVKFEIGEIKFEAEGSAIVQIITYLKLLRDMIILS